MEKHVQINLVDRKDSNQVDTVEKNRQSKPILGVDDRTKLITDEGNIQGSKVLQEKHVQINLVDRKDSNQVDIVEKNRQSTPILELDDRTKLITDQGNIQGNKVFLFIQTCTYS